MTKNCPNCGKSLPEEARFCGECGYDFSKESQEDNIFKNGKIFLVLIAIIIVVGAFVIFSFGGNNGSVEVVDDANHVDMTITEVKGYDGTNDGKTYYTIYTSALFNNMPDDMKGYNVKTSYFDENNTEIGYEIESLSHIYYDTEYALSFGYYKSYVKPTDLDHVTVEIIKDGDIIDNFTAKVDKNKIDFLN